MLFAVALCSAGNLSRVCPSPRPLSAQIGYSPCVPYRISDMDNRWMDDRINAASSVSASCIKPEINISCFVVLVYQYLCYVCSADLIFV